VNAPNVQAANLPVGFLLRGVRRRSSLDSARIGLLVHSMTPTNSSRPSLSVRPCMDRSGWYVEAWWPNRPLEKLGHFQTHPEAREWVALESTSFFVLREIGSSVKHAKRSTA
jgi:hypothetical protein